jgi:hypothetical protein
MTTEDDNDHGRAPEMSAKAKQDVALIQSSFRLDGERVIRLSNGSEATGTRLATGYVQVRAGSSTNGSQRWLYLHRVKFVLAYGWLPERIDHIDGDPSNNLLSNLRPCTPSQNAANASYAGHPLPESGHRGVYPLLNGKFKWQARIGGIQRGRQPFDTPEEAKEDLEAARKAHHGPYHRRTSKAQYRPQANTKIKKAKATKVQRKEPQRRKGMWTPPISDAALTKAFFDEIRRTNPLFANSSDEELRAIVKLMT